MNNFFVFFLQQKLDELHRLWEMLLMKISQKGIKLNEALILLQFTKKCEEILFWIGDKEHQLNLDDFRPEDVDHIEVFQRKYDELMKDMNGEQHRINDLNNHADKLVKDAHQNSNVITEKKKQLNDAWNNLKKLVELRGAKLKGGHDVFHFNQEAAETLAWITDKDELLALEDQGKDLPNVQALQRKHEGFERDLAAVEDKVVALGL